MSRQGVSSSMSFNPTSAFIIVYEPTAAEQADPNTTIYYYGFEAHDGGWYIQRRDTGLGIDYYATGDSGLATAYANKVSQSYYTFATTFRSQL